MQLEIKSFRKPLIKLKHSMQFFVFFFWTLFHSKFWSLFLFCFVKLISSKFRHDSSSKPILVEILCVSFTLCHHWLATEKKVEASWTSFQSHNWSKNLWSCATTDTLHAQRFYLTIAQLPVASWRTASRTHPNIYDEGFYERLLSFIDFQLGYKYTSEKMEIFKMNLRLGKTSWLLQRAMFLLQFTSAVFWLVYSF